MGAGPGESALLADSNPWEGSPRALLLEGRGRRVGRRGGGRALGLRTRGLAQGIGVGAATAWKQELGAVSPLGTKIVDVQGVWDEGGEGMGRKRTQFRNCWGKNES